MTASDIETIRGRLQTVTTLAHLLERIERSDGVVNPDQYQAVVAKLKEALSQPLPDTVLNAVLAAHPATAEVYENLHYSVSGLSRSSLDRSVSSEMLAAQVLSRFTLQAKSDKG